MNRSLPRRRAATRPATRAATRAAALAAALGLGLLASACGSDTSHRTTGAATVTSAPTGPATIADASDPGAGPTSLDGVDIGLEKIATVKQPVALTSRPGTDDLYVAEQGGRVDVLRVATDAGGTKSFSVDPDPALDLTDQTKASGERGLLGIAFSADGQHLYVDYTDQDGNSHIVEYPMDGDRADASAERQLIFQTQPFPNHNGGNLVLGPDGYLYIGFGDGGSGGDPFGNGQNTHTLLGKILRIDPTGRTGDLPYAIPADNPFADGIDGSPEIWLYGVRNPWRFSFDRQTSDLWVADVGQDLYEEVDLLPAVDGRDAGRGANLGWNLTEGTHPYQDGVAPPGATVPLFDYSHEGGNCSIIGGYVYRGAAVPALVGTYLFGDYCVGEVRGLLQRNGTKLDERSLDATVGQGLTSFGEGNDGELYVLDATGPIYRIGPV